MTKEIDWDKIDSMFVAGCNIEQTAAALGCSRDCLYARCLKEKNTTLSAYHQEKRKKGDALLHSAQYHKAYEDKNPTMLIWLGKQRLNQKDTDDHDKRYTNIYVRSDPNLGGREPVQIEEISDSASECTTEGH